MGMNRWAPSAPRFVQDRHESLAGVTDGLVSVGALATQF